jgi:hypothetical protein
MSMRSSIGTIISARSPSPPRLIDQQLSNSATPNHESSTDPPSLTPPKHYHTQLTNSTTHTRASLSTCTQPSIPPLCTTVSLPPHRATVSQQRLLQPSNHRPSGYQGSRHHAHADHPRVLPWKPRQAQVGDYSTVRARLRGLRNGEGRMRWRDAEPLLGRKVLLKLLRNVEALKVFAHSQCGQRWCGRYTIRSTAARNPQANGMHPRPRWLLPSVLDNAIGNARNTPRHMVIRTQYECRQVAQHIQD